MAALREGPGWRQAEEDSSESTKQPEQPQFRVVVGEVKLSNHYDCSLQFCSLLRKEKNILHRNQFLMTCVCTQLICLCKITTQVQRRLK